MYEPLLHLMCSKCSELQCLNCMFNLMLSEFITIFACSVGVSVVSISLSYWLLLLAVSKIRPTIFLFITLPR